MAATEIVAENEPRNVIIAPTTIELINDSPIPIGKKTDSGPEKIKEATHTLIQTVSKALNMPGIKLVLIDCSVELIAKIVNPFYIK